ISSMEQRRNQRCVITACILSRPALQRWATDWYRRGFRTRSPADSQQLESPTSRFVCFRARNSRSRTKWNNPALGSFLPNRKVRQKVARFRKVNNTQRQVHHDALEFPDGQIVLLTRLREGQYATVLQLPAIPRTRSQAEENKLGSLVA